jgi:two-component system sensor kinase FixL
MTAAIVPGAVLVHFQLRNTQWRKGSAPCDRRAPAGTGMVEVKPLAGPEEAVAPIGAWAWHMPSDRITWSADTFRLWGRDPAEGQPRVLDMMALVHADDRARLRSALDLAMQAGCALDLDFRVVRPDGALRWLRMHGSIGRDDAGGDAVLHGVALDVTIYHDVRQALEEREAQLRSILETVPEAMIVVDDHGLIRSFSTTAEGMFGHQAATVLGRNVSILMPSPDRERHDGYMQRYMTTGERRIIGIGRVVRGLRADGSEFPMHLTIGEVDRGPGRRLFIGFVQDMSQHEADEARMNELRRELLHVSRLGDMGQMASALAHELNQPLTAAAAAVRAAERMLGSGPPVPGTLPQLREAMALATEQVLRAGQIVRRLRDFVDKGRAERHREDLAKVIDDACALAMVGTAERGVSLRVTVPRGMPPLLMDRVQIQQVLVNLIRNAVEAMCGEGSRPSARPRELVVTATDGESVTVSVADTGPGLAPDVAARLFEPFVTSKRGGMGVGLSICRSIVEAHGGRLWADANPGGGTVFRFELPALPAEAPAG